VKLINNLALVALLAAGAAQPAFAKDKPAKQYVMVNPDVGVPVFPNDITERPYTVLGEVKAGIRKATVFSGEASQEKIYHELWERAEKMGADAVVKAQYGNATGTAVKFVDAAAVAPGGTVAAAPNQ
jgi:uncharacterized protein YbjQ (UPF0145 family)